MSITEDAVNTVINADNACPANCSLDNIHTTKSYQYTIATGAYTINYQGSRHFLGIDPTTRIQWEQVTQSQGSAFGVWPLLGQLATGTLLGAVPNAGVEIVRIHPSQSNVDSVNPGIACCGFNAGALDPQQHHYFAVVFTPTFHFSLVTVDTQKGSVITTTPLNDTSVPFIWPSGVAGLQFDPGTGTLLGSVLTATPSAGSPYTLVLVRIDPATGNVQPVGHFGSCCFITGAFDAQHQQYFAVMEVIIGAGFGFNLVTVDTQTGNVIRTNPFTDPTVSGFGVDGLQFDPGTGTLLGVIPNGEGLVRIDPSTGAVQFVALGLGCCGFLTGAFDAQHQQYFAAMYPSLPGGQYSLVTVDTLNDALIASHPINDVTVMGFGIAGLQFDPGGCQVNVQQLGQCRLFHTPPDPDPGILPGWPSGTSALDQYAFHTPYLPAQQPPLGTICTLGCALTTLSMALNQAGMTQIPYCGPLTPVACAGLTSNDPGSLNNFLKFPPPLSVAPSLLITVPSPPGLYAPGNNTSFDVATRWLAAALKLPKPWYFDLSHEGEPGAFAFSGSPCLGVACETLDKYLCGSGQPVIVRVVGADGIFGDHKVLVVGKQGYDYLINDPANQNGTGSPRHTLLSQYSVCEFGTCTALFSIVGVVKDPSGDVGGLDVATDTNAELLVVDSNARRTGFDALSGKDVKEIPNSTHYVEATDDEQTGAVPTEFSHIVSIFQPGSGNYQIVLAGLHSGTYAFAVTAFSQDGSAQPVVVVQGVATVGSISSFQIQFSSSSGSSTTVARIASFQSTLADIANSLQLGLIANAGIANALSSKIRTAASAVAEHESDDAKEVLKAFKRQVTAQTGKSITGVAPQMLQEDANSLLSQLR